MHASPLSSVLLPRLLLQQLRFEGTLHELEQVFFMAAGDWAVSFVQDVSAMGSQTGSLTVGGLQRILEETMKVSIQCFEPFGLSG